MRVLVIGGSGAFIGARVVQHLQRLNHDVAVFSRRPLDLASHSEHIVGDRRRLAESAAALRAFKPNVVVDVILSSGAQGRELVGMFRGVADRVVAISSMDVYRACGVLHRSEEGPLEPLPLKETSPLRSKQQTYPPPQIAMLQQVFGWLDDEYDKIPVEREVLGDAELRGTVLRLPMVYGPGDKLHRFFPVLKRIADGRQTIVFAESLAAWRGTKGYVDDVAAAIALAATSDRAARQVYNVGERDVLTEFDWARRVAEAAGWSGESLVVPDDHAPAHLLPPANWAQHWVADTRRIREELGYVERVGRDEGIRRTVEWERVNPPAQIDAKQFDYGAEDEAVEKFRIPGSTFQVRTN
jgi:nucleoside-diphosphate-sugar epimerase